MDIKEMNEKERDDTDRDYQERYERIGMTRREGRHGWDDK
jgi:hypothetical protein